MFKYLVLEGYCENNIPEQAGKIGTPKEIKMGKRQKSYEVITYEEYLRLIEASKDNSKFNTMFDLWFTRGPRPGEIRAFRIKDFDYKKKQLMVNNTINKKNELKDPKTASSKATIDLDDEVANKIKKLIDNLKKQKSCNDDWFIFNGPTPISEHSIRNARDKYFKKANINKHIKLHEFRHSCATWLFSINIPVTVISRILRHKDISVTMATYIHLINQQYTEQLKIINNMRNAEIQVQKQVQQINETPNFVENKGFILNMT